MEVHHCKSPMLMAQVPLLGSVKSLYSYHILIGEPCSLAVTLGLWIGDSICPRDILFICLPGSVSREGNLSKIVTPWL